MTFIVFHRNPREDILLLITLELRMSPREYLQGTLQGFDSSHPAVTPEEQENGIPLCPDFVVELMSRSGRLKTVQEKMEEYMANGARLGWLIDPYKKTVYIYLPAKRVECLENPPVSGEPVLPGFLF